MLGYGDHWPYHRSIPVLQPGLRCREQVTWVLLWRGPAANEVEQVDGLIDGLESKRNHWYAKNVGTRSKRTQQVLQPWQHNAVLECVGAVKLCSVVVLSRVMYWRYRYRPHGTGFWLHGCRRAMRECLPPSQIHYLQIITPQIVKRCGISHLRMKQLWNCGHFNCNWYSLRIVQLPENHGVGNI
jgi:hypothetical protein